MLVFIVSEINVLYCFDNNFWKLAAVSIRSLVLTQKKTTRVNLYCMVAPHTRGRRVIQKLVNEIGGRLIWREIKRRENPYRGYDYSRWSPVIFYRLFASEIFPQLDKILYIDSDTLIRDDLSKLYNTDVRKYAMGAVRDMAPVEIKDHPTGKYVREFIEKYLKHGLYINSGVLLMNLQKFRTMQSDLLGVSVPLKYPDQDILNVALDGKILSLPLKYNVIPDLHLYPRAFSAQERKESRDHPVISHCYATKPYVYDPREIYSIFYKTCVPLGFYPEDFIKADKKRWSKRNKYSSRTHIPHLRLTRRGYLRLFGILRV